jgi:hypothetical protein
MAEHPLPADSGSVAEAVHLILTLKDLSAWPGISCRATFHWEWIGGLPGVRISYDHRFESSGPAATRLEWLVELRGPLAPLIRPVFARIYGRNLDQAIPRLQEWFRR